MSRRAVALVEPGRLDREQRRDALLDVASAMVADRDIEAITMEAVAERAKVSRPLVYKHFANRHELLAAVYARESATLHTELEATVAAENTLAGMLRALIRGALRAEAEHGGAFAALRSAGSRTSDRRREQRQRDRTTLGFFASRAEKELGIDRRSARAGLSIQLGAITSVLATWRTDPTEARAQLLEDTYVEMAIGGLERLATIGGVDRTVAARTPR